MESFGFNKPLIAVCRTNMRSRVVYTIVPEWVNFTISCGFDQC